MWTPRQTDEQVQRPWGRRVLGMLEEQPGGQSGWREVRMTVEEMRLDAGRGFGNKE